MSTTYTYKQKAINYTPGEWDSDFSNSPIEGGVFDYNTSTVSIGDSSSFDLKDTYYKFPDLDSGDEDRTNKVYYLKFATKSFHIADVFSKDWVFDLLLCNQDYLEGTGDAKYQRIGLSQKIPAIGIKKTDDEAKQNAASTYQVFEYMFKPSDNDLNYLLFSLHRRVEDFSVMNNDEENGRILRWENANGNFLSAESLKSSLDENTIQGIISQWNSAVSLSNSQSISESVSASVSSSILTSESTQIASDTSLSESLSISNSDSMSMSISDSQSTSASISEDPSASLSYLISGYSTSISEITSEKESLLEAYKSLSEDYDGLVSDTDYEEDYHNCHIVYWELRAVDNMLSENNTAITFDRVGIQAPAGTLFSLGENAMSVGRRGIYENTEDLDMNYLCIVPPTTSNGYLQNTILIDYRIKEENTDS